MEERRDTPRRSLRLEVVLLYRGLGLLRGVTRDVSLGGMYIELAGAPLPEAAKVRILWRHPQRESPCQLPAVIVRSDDHGVAARFRALEPTAGLAVQALVDGAPAL